MRTSRTSRRSLRGGRRCTGAVLGAVALASTVLTGLVVAGSSPAHAADPYKPSGGSINLALAPGSSVVFTIMPSLTSTTCTSFTLSGAVENPAAPRAHSTRAGYLNGLTGTCTTPQYGATQVTTATPWDLEITGDAPSGSTQWPAAITGVDIDVDWIHADCTYDLHGDITGTFDTATQKFTALGSTLVFDNSAGADCATFDILDGDPVDVSASWGGGSAVWVNSGTPITLGH
ncbi:hypothetical protein [Pimelobacter simplex]|uniref:hypothetical protein n=1 Tax=Nocardioides simplex TaxID=2045 RepID=UPI003AAD8872